MCCLTCRDFHGFRIRDMQKALRGNLRGHRHIQVVVEMVKSRLSAEDAQTHGWLLDGYPRSAEQAEAIEAVNIRPDIFILINVCARTM